MKRFLCLLCFVLLIFPLLATPVLAHTEQSISASVGYSPVALRAGGGSSGGGGGGSSGGGGGSSGGRTHVSGRGGQGSQNPLGGFLSSLVMMAGFAVMVSAGAIVYRLRISKFAKNTKRLMLLLQRKDSAWKYSRMQDQVRTTYFAVQKAWSNLDMTPAQPYLSEELFNSYQTQLNWMKMKHQRNVLKRIKLREAVPVAVHDSEDDTEDFVWFYIKGRMIDYTIDTETNMKVAGSSVAESFCEYWQFVRKEETRWVLNRILQKDEGDQIAFTAE